MADKQEESYAGGDGKECEQFLVAFFKEMAIAGNDAACHIVGAHHETAFERGRKSHLSEAIESKSAGIVPILAIHAETRSIGLIFHYHEWLL